MRRVIGAGVLVGAVFATAACGGDPSSSPSPSPSVSPSPSPSSTAPTPPPLPDAARKDTKAGAVAFVRHYVELINYAQATGDVGSLEKASSQDCDSCAAIAAKARAIYGAGGHVSGGAWRTKPGHTLRNGSVDGWTVDALVRYGPQDLVESAGASPRHLNGGATTFTFIISGRHGQWRVEDFTRSQ